MSPFVSTINQILATLVLASQIAFLASLVGMFLSKNLKQWLGKRAMLFSFLVALTSTLGSLFYSEIAGFDPCKLCWFERIFMYPMVIIFGVALFKKTNEGRGASLILSGLGIVMTAYHYLLQRGIAPEVPCSAVGYSEICSKVFTMTYGYITIPLMALTGFVLIFALQTLSSRKK